MIHRWGSQAQAWIYELLYMSVLSRFVKTTLIACLHRQVVEPLFINPFNQFKFHTSLILSYGNVTARYYNANNS